jgi:CRISPR type IV-associated protein Csf3
MVRAWLQSGVVADGYLPLDAVVYAALMRELRGPKGASAPGAHALNQELGGVGARMPFERRNCSTEQWYYACSFAQWPEAVANGKDYWSKRFDAPLSSLVDFRGRRGRIVTGSGRYKGYRHPVYYRHALYVDWYCVGRAAELRRLLAWCSHLGKETGEGWGAVLRWEVSPWLADWSETDVNGRLMRAIPDPSGSRLYGIRPSYWSPRHQFPCRLPELIS